MRLAYSGCSQSGLVRSTNEDAYLMRTAGQAALFLVADGIGGKEHGEIVSGMLRDGYDQWFRARLSAAGVDMSLQTAVSELKEVLFKQNRAVIERFGALSAGSTLVLLFLLRDRYVYLSSGDSRIYLGQGASFQQITMDDIYENLKEPPAKFEPAEAGKLVGAVGISPTPEFTVGTGVLRKGDRFFLCSDGVYRYISPRKLSAKIWITSRDPNRLIASISKEVEGNGAGDNYSMIYVRVNSI